MTATLKASAAPTWVMAGTEGTNKYRVIARGDGGRIGFRLLGDTLRLRIEPSGETAAIALAEHFPSNQFWKQPGPMDSAIFRFSQELPKGEEAVTVVEMAIKALSTRGKLERNTAERYWRKAVR